MWIVGYVLRERTFRIRVGQRIQVYDIKTRLAYGGHGVCAEKLNTLKKKKLYWWLVEGKYILVLGRIA